MKEKISISIEEHILPALDGLVDNRLIRNRSQAVEFVLQQYFDANAPVRAVLLGGKLESNVRTPGTISAILSQLKKAGISEILVAGGPATESLFNQVQTDPFFSPKAIFLREKTPQGTGGALKLAENYLKHTFVVAYLDVSFEIDLVDMLAQHKKNRALATMAVTYVQAQALTDYVRIKGDTITTFEYKSGRTTPLQNAGVYVFEPRLLSELSVPSSLEKDFFPSLVADGQLKAFIFDTQWEHTG